MPVGTAFHERTLALCESLNFKEWSGYYTVGAYEMTHEHEYNAIRNSSALDRYHAALQVLRFRPRRHANSSIASSPATSIKSPSIRSFIAAGAIPKAK